MFDIYTQFAADEAKENEGVDCPLGADSSIKVARSGNKKYARMLSAAVEKNQRVLDLKNDASDEVSDQIMVDVLAHTILLGWKNIKFKGADLPYSVDNAKMLLRVKDFRALVTKLSNDFEAYRQVSEAAASGN